MNIAAYQKHAHHQAMGIAQAVQAHKKESYLSKLLAGALAQMDWAVLMQVQEHFEELSPRERAAILQMAGNSLEITDAISRLEVKIYLNEAWWELGGDDPKEPEEEPGVDPLN